MRHLLSLLCLFGLTIGVAGCEKAETTTPPAATPPASDTDAADPADETPAGEGAAQ